MNKFDYAESIEYELLFKWFMCRKGHRKSRWKRKWARFFNKYNDDLTKLEGV